MSKKAKSSGTNSKILKKHSTIKKSTKFDLLTIEPTYIDNIEESCLTRHDPYDKNNRTLDDKLWEISNAFIDQYGLVSMHTDSFNYAIEDMIPAIVAEKGKISLLRNGETHFVEFTNIIAKSPPSTPKMCMDKSLSYAAGLYCDIVYKGPNNQINKYEKKYIGDIYIPVYSNLCNLSRIKGDKYKLASLQEDINDIGGYFILKGSQKVIVPQVRPSHNSIHIFNGKAASSNGKPKFSKYTEVKCGGLTSHITTVQVGICTKSNLISVTIPYIDSCSIPLGIVFCGLGVTNPRLIASFVFEQSIFEAPPTIKHKEAIYLLAKSLEQSWNIFRSSSDSDKIQENALCHIGLRGKKMADATKSKKVEVIELTKEEREQAIQYATHLLSVEFLAHVTTHETSNNKEESSYTPDIRNTFLCEKAVYLGYMTRKLLLARVGLMPVSDRDHVANKRVHTTGMILAAHFYKAFCQLTGKIVGSIDSDLKKKRPINVASYITSPYIITSSFTSALMSNKWNSTGPAQGISQTIDNFNHVAFLSFMRKFVIPMANEGGKIEPPRHLHGSQWGCSCFTGDTLITLSNGTTKSIEELQQSPEIIMTVNPITFKNEPSGFYNFFSKLSREVYLIEDTNGNKIKCTDDHPFLVIKDETSAFLQAKDLTNNHCIISVNIKDDSVNTLPHNLIFLEGIDKKLAKNNKSISRIKSIEKLPGVHTVYDFTTICSNHTIIANNIITSNCPYETPEGKRVGLVQILTLGSFITIGCDHHPIVEFLKDMILDEDRLKENVGIHPLLDVRNKGGVNPCELDNFLVHTRIFVNGIPQGYTQTPNEIVAALRNMRRKCNINPSISISYDKIDNEINILTDAGRMIRGLCILDKGKLAIPEHILDGIKLEREKEKYRENNTGHNSNGFRLESSVWMYLLENGYVELIDKSEEENLNVAIYPSDLETMPAHIREQYTHCEMTPDMIEGVGANTSPKNDCNQAPRNIYQSAMAKQSIGVPGLNHKYHRKGKWHALVYPQKPIVNTRIARKVGLDNVPMGQNATVLVMPWYGLNQEDSLVLNEDAINRGFMCSYAYTAYEAVIKNPNLPGSSKYEEFKIPQKEMCNDYRGNMNKLKEKTIDKSRYCYVPEGVEVHKGDVLVGMVMTYTNNPTHINSSIHGKKNSSKVEMNISIIYDQKLPATIHSITCGKNGDGYDCIRLVTRQYRKPMRGDKFAARHGQKGTAGEIMPSKDMPFLVRLGYTPNILINPLAFPSRMTIGLFVEAIMGISLTATALKHPEYNAPLFEKSSEKDNESESLGEKDDLAKYPKNFNPQTDYAMNLTGDASPFIKSFDVKYILRCIEKLGVPGFSEEEIIVPKTGERAYTLVFHGVMYYQRLKHMVMDKIHARATGSSHALHRQPTEGRKKKGGFRIGHMERDASWIDSPLALKEGVAVKMGKMSRYESVWGWEAENELLIKSQQINHFKPREKTAYIITLQDGRTITTSDQHTFYVRNDENERKIIEMEDNDEEIKEGDIRNNRYVEVRHLIVNEDRIFCTLTPPLVDFDEDMAACQYNPWNSDFFNEINPNFGRLSEYEVLRKSLALARLIGFAITDGHAHAKSNIIEVYSGHTLDTETILDDIKRIAGVDLDYKEDNGIYMIKLPINLSKAIRKMGIIKGAKVNQDAMFPDFIHEMTPLPILREFLGGLFGGDGHTCCLSSRREKDLMKSVSISWTKDPQHLLSLQKHMETLHWILKLSFGIESTIQQPKMTTHSKNSGGDHKQILLNIPIEYLVAFSEKIGFRYCEHKAIRLSAGVSYRRFRENVLRQRLWISERVDQIVGYRAKKEKNPNANIYGLAKAVKQATSELEKIEPILHKESVPVPKRVGQLLTNKVNNEIRSSTFPTAGDYMRDIDALKLFLNENDPDSKEVTYGTQKDQHGVPSYYLKVIDVRKQDYTVQMCDITVDKSTSSYVINGMVSHNCMLAQGVPEMVQDRMLYQSDVYKMPVCQVCGLEAIDDGKIAYCRVCQTSKVVMVQVPFGTKLLSQELRVLNIVPRIIISPDIK